MKFKAASQRTHELWCGVKAKRHFGHDERLDPLLTKARSRFFAFNSQVKESIQIKNAIFQDSFIALRPCLSMCKVKKSRRILSVSNSIVLSPCDVHTFFCWDTLTLECHRAVTIKHCPFIWWRRKSCASSEYVVLHSQTFTVKQQKRSNVNFWVQKKMHKSWERDFTGQVCWDIKRNAPRSSSTGLSFSLVRVLRDQSLKHQPASSCIVKHQNKQVRSQNGRKWFWKWSDLSDHKDSINNHVVDANYNGRWDDHMVVSTTMWSLTTTMWSLTTTTWLLVTCVWP